MGNDNYYRDESELAKQSEQFYKRLYEYADGLPITRPPKGVPDFSDCSPPLSPQQEERIRHWLVKEIYFALNLPGVISDTLDFSSISDDQWMNAETLVRSVSNPDDRFVKGFPDAFRLWMDQAREQPPKPDKRNLTGHKASSEQMKREARQYYEANRENLSKKRSREAAKIVLNHLKSAFITENYPTVEVIRRDWLRDII